MTVCRTNSTYAQYIGSMVQDETGCGWQCRTTYVYTQTQPVRQTDRQRQHHSMVYHACGTSVLARLHSQELKQKVIVFFISRQAVEFHYHLFTETLDEGSCSLCLVHSLNARLQSVHMHIQAVVCIWHAFIYVLFISVYIVLYVCRIVLQSLMTW